MKRSLLRLGRTLLIGYAVLVLVVAGCQNKLIYFPERGSEPAMITEARRARLEPWRDAAGGIIGWRRPNPHATARLVVFHGNAGNALGRDLYVEAFQPPSAGWEVLLFEYPGYGARAGDVGEKSFASSAKDAVAALTANDPRPVFALGESIGSGTACALARDMPDSIAGLLLVVPFARLPEVAAAKLPWLPVRLLLRDKYDNIAALANYRRPVVFLVAAEDEVVSAAQGRKLHAGYTGPKLLIELPDTGHNDFPVRNDAGWVRDAGAFLRGK